MTKAEELKRIFTDGRYRTITVNICRQKRDMVDDTMHDTYLSMHDNYERTHFSEAIESKTDLPYFIYHKWCWLTFNSNAFKRRYGIGTRDSTQNYLLTGRELRDLMKGGKNAYYNTTANTIKYSYEFIPCDPEQKKQAFEYDLFKKLLRPHKDDNEEEHYYKGLLREYLGVTYDKKGKPVHNDPKSSRSIGGLTGISYVTVSRDIKDGIKYIYKQYNQDTI
jgi:hypothetical protein